MTASPEQWIYTLSIWAIPVLFAITLHEAAHGYTAYRLGDKTAWMLGRLSLNPIRHIDPIGTLLVPAALLMLGGLLFGWAKPVPINVRVLKNIRRDMAIIAIAGPLANLLMAIFWAFVMKFSTYASPSIRPPIAQMGYAGVQINVILAAFNCLPIPPLDGSRILSACLPKRWSYHFDALERYGFLIVLALVVTGVMRWLITPVYGFFMHAIAAIS